MLKCFPGGWDDKESARNAGDLGSISGFGRFPGERNGYPLQYSCQENFMDRGAWRATVHGVAKESDMTEQLTLCQIWKKKKKKKTQKTKTLKPLCSTRLSRQIINNFNVFIQIQVLRTEIELLSSMNPSPHFQRRDSAFTEGTRAS